MKSGLTHVVMLACLVIACAGFAGFQWFQSRSHGLGTLDEKELARLLNGDSPAPHPSEHYPESTQLINIRKAAAKLSKTADEVAISGKRAKGPLRLIEYVDGAFENLRKSSTTTPAELTAASVARLEAYYFATQLLPSLYRQQFDSLAISILAEPIDTEVAAQIEILRFLVDYDLSLPLDDAALQAIGAKSKAFPEQLHGIALYSIVADKLVVRGQIDSAIELLEQSLVQYEGHPGRRQLLDQLIALRQPPPAKGYVFDQPSDKKKGRSGGYRGNVWRPSSLDPEVFQREWKEKVQRDHAIHNGL